MEWIGCDSIFSMKNKTNELSWQSQAKKMIKLEMLKRDVGYEQLSELMQAAGTHDTPGNLKTKINRGTFSAAFLLQVLNVIGCELSIEDK